MKIIFTEKQISDRLQELGAELTRQYQGKPLTCVALMTGAFIFAADLVRRMPLKLQMETLKVASYQGTRSTGEVRFLNPFKTSLKGRHVLLLDDILDSGLTFARVLEKLREQEPADIRTCVLLEKDVPRKADAVQHADYAAFHVENEFIVGCGLDYNEDYRNLPYIAVMNDER